MRSALILAVAGLTMIAAAPLAAAQTPTQPAAPVEEAFGYAYHEYFPEMFSGVGFTMQKTHFLEYLADRQMTYNANTSKTMFAVATPGAPFTSVVFFFYSNAGEILTEIELRFADETQAKAYRDVHYPGKASLTPGAPLEFIVQDIGSSYRAKAWQFKEKVYFVAAMPNTRWSNQ